VAEVPVKETPKVVHKINVDLNFKMEEENNKQDQDRFFIY
jgi:hypothetical protein